MSARRMRLLLTADAVGGVWQYAIDLARGLAPFGIDVLVAVIGPAPSGRQRAETRDVRLIETGLPLDWLSDGPEPVRAAGAAIAALARAEAADCVQLNTPALAAETPFPCPVVAVAHGCLATWWEAANGAPLPPEHAWHHDLMRQGLNAAARVVAPTAAYGMAVMRQYRLATSPHVVHNGRRPLALPRGVAQHDFAFTAGRLWDRAKNVAVLDRIAARLAIPFHAAGPTGGPHGEKVTPEHLHLLGVLDEEGMARRLAARPVFVSPARFEPFGLAVLEAAAAGCPLVLSDIPTFRELWADAAIFVDSGDDLGFVEAIERIVGDDMARRSLGEAARERARRHTPAAMAAAMARLYARLLARPGSWGRAAA